MEEPLDPDRSLAWIHQIRRRATAASDPAPGGGGERRTEPVPMTDWSADRLAAEMTAGALREQLEQRIAERDHRIAQLEEENRQLRQRLATIAQAATQALVDDQGETPASS